MGLIKNLVIGLIVFGMYSTAIIGFIGGYAQANNIQTPPGLQPPNLGNWQNINSTMPNIGSAPSMAQAFLLNIGQSYNSLALSLQALLGSLGVNISFYISQILLLITALILLTFIAVFLGFFSVL